MKRILFYASAVAIMFSSCSKDTTEISVPESGNLGVFSASIELDGGPSTRLHLDKNEDGKWIYVWDGGDGIGVSSVAEIEANVPAYTLQETIDPQFSISKNDLRYFGGWNDEGVNLYAYYPYNPEGGVLALANDGTGNIVANLKINDVQRYEFESFYKNTVSAVGYVDKYVLGESHFKMQVPFSVLRFKVRGFGETKALTLKIKKPYSTEYYDLAGKAQVVIPTDAEEKPSFMLTDDNDDNSQQIVLTFGSEAEGFEYDGNDLVTFVVPAGLDLNNAIVELYNGVLTDSNQADLDVDTLLIDFVSSEVENGKYLTKPGAYIAFNSYPFNFGMDGKFVIEDDEEFTAEQKFLAYAYMAQTQNGSGDPIAPINPANGEWGADWDFIHTMGADWKSIAWIKDSELNFTEMGLEWATGEYNKVAQKVATHGNGNPTPEEAFLMRVYDWYITNGGAIEPLAFNSIVGDGIAAQQVTIKGLKVKGTGLIAQSPKHTASNYVTDDHGQGAYLKNLKFVECEVVYNAGATGFLSASTSYNKFTNITIGTGNKVTGATSGSAIGGLYGTSNTTKLADALNGITIDQLPDVSGCSGTVVGQVIGMYNANDNSTINLATYNVVNLTKPVIGTVAKYQNVTGTPVVSFVYPTDATYSANNETVIGSVSETSKVSIIVGDTAYWNGTSVEPNTDDILTAEELAYILASKDNGTIELALNYDMQDKKLDLKIYGQNPNPMVISGAKTISNLKVNTHNKSYYASLFGKTAKLTDVTLKDIEVNVVAPISGSYKAVAGLAQSGTVKNVTVDGLTLNIANGTAVNANIIGGIFSTANTDVLNGGLTVKNTTINNIEGFTSGVVAAVFEVKANNQELKNLNVTTSKVVKSINQMVKANRNNATEYLPQVTAYNKDNLPFGAINVLIAKWENDLTHTFTVESSCSYGERFASRVWFPADFLGEDAANVKLVETDSIVKSDYVFKTNANAGAHDYMNQIGFQKKL